jgi:hypothetical protein
MKVRLALAALVAAGAATVAQAQVCPGIVHEEIAVDGRNDEWTSAQVKVTPGDLVLVFARGKVKVGNFLGAVGPKGANSGEGRLEMKVGTGTVTTVGERWVGAFRQTGSVKFKVYDTNYRDNEGSFHVHLVIIPAGAFPPAIKIEPDA